MLKVFLCSPYRGDVENNVSLAKQAALYASFLDCAPVVPHLMYPSFLNDDLPKDRVKALNMGAALLEACDEIWVYGSNFTTGMQFDIKKAISLGIPFRLYDRDLNRISPADFEIDDRVTPEMREVLQGAKFV